MDADQPSERFTFSFTMAKAVVPDVAVSTGASSSRSSGVSATLSPTTTMAIMTTASASASKPASSGENNGNSKLRRWLRIKREEDPTSQETPTTAEPAICWYNQTVVRGTVWTRLRATYPSDISDVPTPLINATNTFAPWPFRVELTLEQTYEEDERGNGKKAPDCRDAQGRPVVFNGNNDNGMKVAGAARARARDMQIVDEADICRCSYTNYGLDTKSNNISSSGSPQRRESKGVRLES